MESRKLLNVFVLVYILVERSTAQGTPGTHGSGRPAQQQDGKSWIDFIKPEAIQCITEIRQIQHDCFKNYDMNMTVVDEFLVGRLQQSHIDIPAQEFVSNLCNKRSRVIECFVHTVIAKRGKDGCKDGQFFNFGVQELVERVTMYNRACSARLFFQMPNNPCMRTMQYETYNCYVTNGLHGHMFLSNGSLEGASIGADRVATQRYCKARFGLYSCIRKIFKKCPVAKEYYLLSGFDYDSMEESLHLLCEEPNLYLKGLECFQSPRENVLQCVNDFSADVLNLTLRQYLDNATYENYYKEYCKLRTRHVDCDVKAWSKQCPADSIGLKNQFQCKMLPKQCQTDKELKIHENVCHESNFNLHLRNSGYKITQSYFIICLVVFVHLIKLRLKFS